MSKPRTPKQQARHLAATRRAQDIAIDRHRRIHNAYVAKLEQQVVDNFTYRIHDAHTNHVLDNGKTYTLKAAQQRMAALDRRSNIVLSFYLTRA